MSLAVQAAAQERSSRRFGSEFGVLAIVGCVLAALVGFTRPEIVRFAPPDTFAYEAQPAVWVFAFATLLPCLAYAQRAGKSLRFGFLLWFILGTVAFAKDFSYIRWPGQPVFVTDVLLFVLLLSLIVLNPKLRLRVGSTTGKLLCFYLAAGVFTFLRSVLEGRPVLLCMRDAAICWYSLFFLLGYLAASDRDKLALLARIFMFGGALTSLAGVFYFLHFPQYGYGVRVTPAGIYAAMSLALLLLMIERNLVERGWRSYGLAVLLVCGVILSGSRTNYLAVFAMVMAAIFCAPKKSRKMWVKRLKPLLRGSIVFVALVCLFAVTPPANRFIDAALIRAYQGIFTPEHDPNAVWRLAAWAAALDMFRNHPITGVGYGGSFHFSFLFDARLIQVAQDTRPHNTYLTVLYEMGLIGILPLLSILFLFFYRAARYLRSLACEDTTCLFVTVLQVGLVVLGMFNLALENPFYGSIFWLNLGAGFWLIQGKAVRQGPMAAALAREW